MSKTLKYKHKTNTATVLNAAWSTKGGDTTYTGPKVKIQLAVWCSGNALVSINAVALHRARLVLGWVTAFGQVNCLIT